MLEPAGFKDFILIVKSGQAAEDRDMAKGHRLQPCNHPSFRKCRNRALSCHVWRQATERPLPAQG